LTNCGTSGRSAAQIRPQALALCGAEGKEILFSRKVSFLQNPYPLAQRHPTSLPRVVRGSVRQATWLNGFEELDLAAWKVLFNTLAQILVSRVVEGSGIQTSHHRQRQKD